VLHPSEDQYRAPPKPAIARKS